MKDNKLDNLKINNLGDYNVTKKHQNIFKSDYPIFVNFYTGDNGYWKYAEKLLKSLNKFNLPYVIVEIDSNGKKMDSYMPTKTITYKNYFREI